MNYYIVDSKNRVLFNCYYDNKLFFITVFGVGIHIKNYRVHPLLYSQRVHPGLLLGNWRIAIIK